MERSTSPLQDDDTPRPVSPRRERARLREDHDNRTSAGELIEQYNAAGWQGLGFTAEEALVFQENLDAVMARALADRTDGQP